VGEEIHVNVPDNGQNGTGQFTLTVNPNSTVEMGTATLAGAVGSQYLQYTQSMNDLQINDTRPNAAPWSVSGQVTNFQGPGGAFLPAKYLGWAPSVVSAGAGALADPLVAPGYPVTTNPGLSSLQPLAHAVTGHGGAVTTQATLDALLTLQVPTTATAGSYTGTLTLTALS
jgi:hypothetical protein